MEPDASPQRSSAVSRATTVVRVAKVASKAGLQAVLVPAMVVLLLLAGVFGLLVVAGTVVTKNNATASPTSGDSTQPGVPASGLALTQIPKPMLQIYQSDIVQRQCPGLSWTVVAAITHLESGDNRNPGAVSSAGALGANQFIVTTWDHPGQRIVDVGQPYGEVPDGQGYALDGDGDGLADIMNPRDSVPAAARLLCANGGGDPKTLPKAIYAYNHAWWYVYGGISDSGTYFIGVLPQAALFADSSLASGAASKVLSAAESQLGLPYVFGGERPGQYFDCSGLVQWAFLQAGIALPRTSQNQWTATRKNQVTPQQAQAGDLIFFAGSDGTMTAPGHIGIIVDPVKGTMINAPHTGTVVRIESYLGARDLVGITNPYAG